jgi:hypothetical protein
MQNEEEIPKWVIHCEDVFKRYLNVIAFKNEQRKMEPLSKNEHEYLNKIRKAGMSYISGCLNDEEYFEAHPYVLMVREVVDPVIKEFVNEVLNKAMENESKES